VRRTFESWRIAHALDVGLVELAQAVVEEEG
jgi:hypothetical protein